MRWNLKPKPSLQKITDLSSQLNVDEAIAILLIQRGIDDFDAARKFFRPSLNDLHDPYLMKDMDKAVARIEKAVANYENILVFGDYDVDGTTAVSLVSSYLKSYYSQVATYIPDRYDEGYGISYKGINFAEDNGFSLIIALDCGIKSVDHILYANKKNIDFIICDHHLPSAFLPDAIAILDPKRIDCNYPYEELCGCGIGFKLIQALAKNQNQTIKNLVEYLDLVAIAIAADIVPITGENRVLAKFGMEIINRNPRPGILALLQNKNKKIFTITDVVFIVAPRINAAGRIKHGNYAVALLTEIDFSKAQKYASEIENFNLERKGFDRQITQEALFQIEENNEKENFSTVVFNEFWHKGVIGIVASRLTENFYRPTLVFTRSKNEYAGSARSVKDFDVYKAIENCAEHLEQFGGHKYAAGMTILPENYENFKRAFEHEVKTTISPELLIPEISIDTELNFEDITDKFVRILSQFEPFGPQNMTPVFITKNIIDTGFGKTIGQQNEHLKLFVKQNNREGIAAIGFGLGEKLPFIINRNPCEMVYCIDENHWKGKVSMQLKIKDVRQNQKL